MNEKGSQSSITQIGNQKIIKYDNNNKNAKVKIDNNKVMKFTPKKGENDKQNIWIGSGLGNLNDSDEEWIKQ